MLIEKMEENHLDGVLEVETLSLNHRGAETCF